MPRILLTSEQACTVRICGICTLFQKLRGGAGSKRYGMDFSRSHEGKEENPRNYNGLRAS
jgi:hypothetical protein